LIPATVPAERVHVVELEHMEAHGMAALVKTGKLPARAMAQLNHIQKFRVKNWTQNLYAQLDATGLFA